VSVERDDHLPPPPQPRGKKARTQDETGAPPDSRRSYVWADRVLFAVGGALLGFAIAYAYLEKVPTQVPLADPHAGIAGVGPGATRDLPGSGGGAPRISTDPALREKVKELDAAVQRSPNDYDLLVKLGNAYYDAEDAKNAVDVYERALKLKGGDANVLTDLGVSYRNLGDPDKALATFDRALAADPKHAPALFNAAIVWGVDKGNAEKARSYLARLKAGATGPEADRLMQAADALEKSLAGRSGGSKTP
jgi:tetratricopeptide (TPR) repeat protein